MESRLVGTPAEGLVSRADLVTVAGATIALPLPKKSLALPKRSPSAAVVGLVGVGTGGSGGWERPFWALAGSPGGIWSHGRTPRVALQALRALHALRALFCIWRRTC
eukprot:361292-Chlamydomonas_euryale.AAC.5